MRTLRTATSCLLVFGWLLASCSDDKPTRSDDPDPVNTTLNWVGTEVLYREADGKHDLSLLFILHAGCGWCQKLKNETLTDPDVIQLLGESFNIAQIDYAVDTAVFWQDSTVSSRYLGMTVYNAGSVPTIIVLDRDGAEIQRISGFKEANELILILLEIRDR